MKIKQLSFLLLTMVYSLYVVAGVKPTLELIMSDTDWMGNAPDNPYWSDDGKSVYFQKKQQGTAIRDWYQINLETKKIVLLDADEVNNRDNSKGSFSPDREFKLFVREGDIYKTDLSNFTRQRITHTSTSENAPQFLSASNEVAFWVGNKAFKINKQGSLIEILSILDEEKSDDKSVAKDYNFLTAQQQRYFITLQEKRKNKKLLKQQSDDFSAAAKSIKPFYLDKNLIIEEKIMSPDGHYILLIVSEKSYKKGSKGKMPRYVNDSGYVEIKKVRTRVGENAPTPHFLVIVDVVNHKQQQIKIDFLPGIDKDPLKKLRKKSAKWHVAKGATKEEAQALVSATGSREVNVWGAEWSKDSKQIAILIKTIDNKDRWIATLATENMELKSQHRLNDKGWINWRFNEFGWLPDSKTIWLVSEESGFAHLYLKNINSKKSRQLTRGQWEVYNPVVTKNGKSIYFRSNQTHPGIYEIFRLDIETKKIKQITHLGGSNTFSLSEDETQLLIEHSTITSKPDLFTKEIGNDKAAVRLTDSMSTQFKKINWIIPTIEKVKSSHVKEAIFSKLYQPKVLDKNKKYPAVIFVHGAGYTQNSHFGWAYYFHELMFHTFLVNQGYIVLDMDYRGSAGYGRDWRTAIYRNMGHPEVEDLSDGINFLVENYQVDRNKIGVYGGSYGGFLTFMAMFREPDLFAAGAALRPVTDWAHYNHQYTSNILNTPAVDPVAYEVSSPIEFAEGLSKPLLIATGMLDDNVFFQDSVRLVQRLIELKKENFEMAVYPMEKHGFKHHTSWLNEYRKIFKLFEENLK